MLSGDAARPGKNAARVLLVCVCRKPVRRYGYMYRPEKILPKFIGI